MTTVPAGTGHYQYLERSSGLGVTYEASNTNNWPGEMPDFPEFELKFITEDATRMAVLLAGDAHIANLSRDLQAEAANRGMRIISSPAAHDSDGVLHAGTVFPDG